MVRTIKVFAAAALMLGALACSQTQHPLSITLANPKTHSVMKCAAHQDVPAQSPWLSDMVELCAKQLEARGFVRVDSSNADQLLSQ